MCPASFGPLRKGIHRWTVVRSRNLACHVRAQVEPLAVRILTTCVMTVRVGWHVKSVSLDADTVARRAVCVIGARAGLSQFMGVQFY